MGLEKLIQDKSPIRSLRTRLQLNQRDFAQVISKSQSFLSDVEAGSIDFGYDVIEKLNELGVDGTEIHEQHLAFMEERLEVLKREVIDKLKNNR